MKKNAIIMISLCIVGVFSGAQEEGAPASPAAAQPDTARLAVIKYGTETEITALINTLKEEGSDELDGELSALADSSKNTKILTAIFAFFADREKGGLEERARKALAERDREANETVLGAIEYLGKLKDGQSAPVLMDILNTQERRFMNAAFRALGRAVGGADEAACDEAAEYLIDYYTNQDPGDENRRDIITSLGGIASLKGVPFLSRIAGDSAERAPLRMAALEALSKLGDENGLATSTDWSEAEGGSPLEAILSCISANDPNVRSAAVAALGPFSGEKADQAVLEAFRDSYYRTRIAAAQASRERKLEAAVPYLKFRSEQDDVPAVKDESIRALGAIATDDAMAILDSLFSERKNTEKVRTGSAEMLMKNKPAVYLDRLIIEMDEAKQKNQTGLYNGFLKIAGDARTESAESFARRLLQSGGIVEKSYGLDLAANNSFGGLAEEIKTLAADKNQSLARKARRTAEKLGISL